jgi:hypothetical protein
MNVSRDSILALQRHFLGALSAPSNTGLEPLSVQPLVFSGDAIRADPTGCAVDFGTVASPGEERRLVRIGNRGPECLVVRLGKPPAWLMARWEDADDDSVSIAAGACTTLALAVPHDAEREFTGTLIFQVGDRVEELRVRMTARRSHPIAEIDFNGSPSPRRFDFGMRDHPYVLTIGNRTSIPLVVTFADLPDCLTFHVDGQSRGGPIDGVFFERKAPFAVQLRPQHLGAHEGILRLRTNDPRSEMRNIELHFTACLAAAKPCVRVAPPPRIRMRADQTATAEASLENWGLTQARTAKESVPAALSVRECPTVPAARDGKPGITALPIRVAPRTLIPGSHTLSVSLRIDGGDPALVTVPVEVDVDAPRRSVLRPEWIIALFAVLFLALLLVIVRGVP